MNTIPFPKVVYLDEEQHDKLKKILIKTNLSKDSLINFWLSKEKNTKKVSTLKNKKNILNSFRLLPEIDLELKKNSYDSKMSPQDFYLACLYPAIEITYDILESPLHISTFKELVCNFENKTEINSLNKTFNIISY